MYKRQAQSHASIIARTFGIPAVVLAGPQVLTVPDGTPCALDGAGGLLVLEPDEPTYARYAHRINLAKRRRVSQERLRTTPCISRDGVPISLLANCSGPTDITRALEPVSYTHLVLALLRERQKDAPDKQEERALWNHYFSSYKTPKQRYDALVNDS